MKLTYFIDTAKNISIRSYEGIVSKENHIKSLMTFWENPGYKLKQNHIIDFTKTDMQLNRSDVLAVVDVMVANVNYRDRIVAFVVAKPQEAAITTMYKELSQHKHISEVFVSKKRALQYIDAPHDFYDMLESKDAVVLDF